MSASFQGNHLSTRIWIILLALTLLTFSVGELGWAGKWVMLGLLFIALVKGQLVAHYFMGLRHTSWLWRGIILGYFLVVGGLIAIAYVSGLH